MNGGIETDIFILYEEAYLEAMRKVCRLDDMEFMLNGNKLFDTLPEIQEGDFLPFRAPRDSYLRLIPYEALDQIINLRHAYINHFYDFENARITIPSSFFKARERFMKECTSEEYAQTEWITTIALNKIS